MGLGRYDTFRHISDLEQTFLQTKGYTIQDTPGGTTRYSWENDSGLFPLYVLCVLLTSFSVIGQLAAGIAQIAVLYTTVRGTENQSR